jgi:hypothetical protein
VTQVQIQHVHNIKPPEKAGAPAAAPPAGPMAPGPMNPMPPGGSGPGRFPVNPQAGAAKPAVNEEDPNLVELGIYGISALYERYEAPKESGGPSGTPGPGGPAAPGPGGPAGPGPGGPGQAKPPAPPGPGR